MKKDNELFKKVKLIVSYGQCADDEDVKDFIQKMSDDEKESITDALSTLDNMFNHAKPS